MNFKLSNHFQKIVCLPETVDTAVDQLMLILDPKEKAAISAKQEYELIDLHFGLGLMIRNGFRLHETASLLLKACGANNPDDGSHVLIVELWRRLKTTDCCSI